MINRDSRGPRSGPPGRGGGGSGRFGGQGGRFGSRRRGPGGRGPRRRRSCYFCGNAIKVIDYKNVDLLWNYLDDREKIVGHRQSGTCSKHQRRLAIAIKRARTVALLPYTPEQARLR